MSGELSPVVRLHSFNGGGGLDPRDQVVEKQIDNKSTQNKPLDVTMTKEIKTDTRNIKRPQRDRRLTPEAETTTETQRGPPIDRDDHKKTEMTINRDDPK